MDEYVKRIELDMALWPAVLKRVEGAAAVPVHDDDFTVYQRVWRQLLAGSLRRS